MLRKLRREFFKINSINSWKSVILNRNVDLNDDDKENNLYDLITGNISCIIINNLITDDDCKSIITPTEKKNETKTFFL